MQQKMFTSRINVFFLALSALLLLCLFFRWQLHIRAVSFEIDRFKHDIKELHSDLILT